MNKLQFNIDEDCLFSLISPEVVDISSDSEDILSIAPGNITQLDEKFRINPAGSNLMPEFVESTIGTLFPKISVTLEHNEAANTSGTQLERCLMELMGSPRMIKRFLQTHL